MQTDLVMLTFGNASSIEVTSEDQLNTALTDLVSLQSGQVVALHRGSKDYIQATRRGELWSVVARREGMWTPQSFTASSTTDYSERCVRESANVSRSLTNFSGCSVRAHPNDH